MISVRPDIAKTFGPPALTSLLVAAVHQSLMFYKRMAYDEGLAFMLGTALGLYFGSSIPAVVTWTFSRFRWESRYLALMMWWITLVFLSTTTLSMGVYDLNHR